MGLKIATVLSCPSIDAATGNYLSAWEQQVVTELRNAAGLTGPTFCAYPNHFKFTPPGSTFGAKTSLSPLAETSRAALLKKLEGYDLALTMGPYAMWCLTGEHSLDNYRGTHIDSPYVAGLQVVPTYSPEVFCRYSWGDRPVVLAAMKKATSRLTDIQRTIYIPDTIADLYAFSTQHIKDRIVFDVETNKSARITDFSIAPSSTCCLYVALEDFAHTSKWSEADELDIMMWLHFLATRKDLSWGFHNATYDLSYLDSIGIRPAGPIFDTMLEHHAWQSELEKSLGFLSALHLPTRAWKHLRTKSKADFNKAGAL